MNSQEYLMLFNHPANSRHKDFIKKYLILRDLYQITTLLCNKYKDIYGNCLDNEIEKRIEEFCSDVEYFCNDNNYSKYQRFRSII